MSDRQIRFIFLFASCCIFLPCGVTESKEDLMERRRQEMVDEQIVSRGVRDLRVLAAMRRVPRHLFVSEHAQDLAYHDFPVGIGFGQTISQPYIVAFMTEALELKATDKVLEVGTGSGYQAAILAEIVTEVYTLEIIPELAAQARHTFTQLGYKNIYVREGNGYEGWAEQAPFDAMIVTAAPERMPTKLIEQLKIGGRMVIPVGSFNQVLYLVTRTERGFDERALLPVRFVPMVGESKE